MGLRQDCSRDREIGRGAWHNLGAPFSYLRRIASRRPDGVFSGCLIQRSGSSSTEKGGERANPCSCENCVFLRSCGFSYSELRAWREPRRRLHRRRERTPEPCRPEKRSSISSCISRKLPQVLTGRRSIAWIRAC